MARASTSDRLTDANIEKVIKMLSAEKPITKKAACEFLGIAYNTTRLDELCRKFTDKKNFREQMYQKKKGTALADEEIRHIASGYLSGETLTDIANSTFRSVQLVKSVVEQLGLPTREVGGTYWNPPMIPDAGVKREYKIGEKCYSARYQSLATIKDKKVDKNGDEVYSIWLEAEEWQQYAYQPWWELADLEPLTKFGVRL